MGHRDRAQGESGGSERGLHPEPGDQPKLGPGLSSLGAWHQLRLEGPASSKALLVRQWVGGPGSGRGRSYLPSYFIHFAPTDPLFISLGMQPWWKLGPREGPEPGPPPRKSQPHSPTSVTWVPRLGSHLDTSHTGRGQL